VPNSVWVRLDKVVKLPRLRPTANPAENTRLPESRIRPETPAAFSPLNIAQWVETAKLVMSTTYQQISYGLSGPLFGAQLGADWQFGNFVVGGELEAVAATIKGNSAFDPAFAISGFASKFRTLATGTGRAGYAFGNFLAYGKFGVAWADIELTYNLFSIRPTVLDHSRTGIVGGAGLEWMLIANLSARLEYDFIYLGAASMNLGGRAPQLAAT